MAPRLTSAANSKRERRYGWCRFYDDFTGHPKWRLVAAKSGVPLVTVHAIAAALLNQASKARPRGWVGEFDVPECAVALDISPDHVARVTGTLVDIGWIDQQYIVDWPDRQPDSEDPTAAERQRNKRTRDRARFAAAVGTASPDQAALLDKQRQEALGRFSTPSRVTGEPPPRPVQVVSYFRLVEPVDDSDAAVKTAAQESERNARLWLIGNGTTLDYGLASKIVAENYGTTRLNADGTVRRWLIEIGGDTVALASIISAADEHCLNGDSFKNTVEQRIAAIVKERTEGPTLPLGVTSVKGGRDVA